MTDAESLAAIRAALLDGRADVAFGSGIDTHLDFPGNSETDKYQFILLGFVLIGLAYWKGSWTVVSGAVVLLLVIYWLYWRNVIRRRMRQRFIDKAMMDMKLWRKSWTFAGVRLSAGAQECLSPKGDWRAFATILAPGAPAASLSAPPSDGASAGSLP